MHLFVAQHRAQDGDLVQVFFDAREQQVGEAEIRRDGSDIEIFRRARVLFEIEGLDVTEGARKLVENNVACASARLNLRAGCADVERPDRVDRGGQQSQTTKFQQVASRSQDIRNSLALHSRLS